MVVKNQKNEIIGNCQQFVAIINSIIKSTIGLVTDLITDLITNLITNLMKCLTINSITEVIVAFNQKNMKMLRFFISSLNYEVLFFILFFNLFFIIL